MAVGTIIVQSGVQPVWLQQIDEGRSVPVYTDIACTHRVSWPYVIEAGVTATLYVQPERLVTPVITDEIGTVLSMKAEGVGPQKAIIRGPFNTTLGEDNGAGAAGTMASPDTQTYMSAVDGALNFTVNTTPVGSVTMSGGMPKWTLNGALDPTAYAGSPVTVAQRNALAPTAGWLVYVKDVGASLNEYQWWDGTAWLKVGSGAITGQYLGSAATFVGLPVVDALAAPASNGDWAMLTADVVGTGTVQAPQYMRGAYVYNGTTFSLAMSLGADLGTFAESTAGTAGTTGIVPAPGSGTQNSTLTGAGTWTGPSKSFVVAMAAALG